MTAWFLSWIWQGAALALAVSVALRFAPRMNAATRHFIWFGTLAALAWLGWAGSPHTSAAAMHTPIADPIYIPSAPDVLISSLVGIWAAFSLVALLRLVPGLHALYSLRDRCYPFPHTLEATLPLWLEAREQGRHTDLMLCDAVQGATVLGLQRPCIAIPSSLVQALSADELDQVILHEHAHVQRRDDWARLGQSLLMSVMWIHPAAFAVSRVLNREREMACDEWVVARTGLPKAYARCLTHAAEVRNRVGNAPALLPTLFTGRHDLVRRVDSLLKIKGRTRRNVSFVRAAAAMLVMAVVSTQLEGIRFAELADIVLPDVASAFALRASGDMPVSSALALRDLAERPIASAFAGDALANRSPLRRDKPALESSTFALRPGADRSLPDKPGESTFDASAFAAAPLRRDEPTVASVSFTGVYPAPSVPSVVPSNRWSALGTPGVEIASAAKKTSIGIANTFSRAGVSLARSF
jgi:beta-lactamase regulating signal transducer with metallopeptidase domain